MPGGVSVLSSVLALDTGDWGDCTEHDTVRPSGGREILINSDYSEFHNKLFIYSVTLSLACPALTPLADS